MAALLSLSLLQPNLSSTWRRRVPSTINPQAALNGAQRMRVPYQLNHEQSRLFHQLPSGLNMEVIVHKGKGMAVAGNPSPPLVFVHGSYHAAWCWAEHWLPFFSASGFDCYAISLLGQGESDAPSASVAGTLKTHASDVADFICKNLNFPPVLIGHSFGGLIIQYYVANAKSDEFLDMRDLFPKLKGAVLVCSVPPSGNSGLVWRYLFTKPIAAFKVTRSLAAKAFQTSLSLCKETFFSATMEDHLVLRFVYQQLFSSPLDISSNDMKFNNISSYYNPS